MKKIIFILFIICFYSVNSQSKFEEITDYFEDYAELSREQIYVHLNKSTFISEEIIWFKGYVFSRDTRELSAQTSNLYCVLLDANDKVVKEKMIMSVNGIAKNQFETDSTFSSGEYTFKVYTNWSKNFDDEYTHYETKLTIINPDEKNIIKPISASDFIDVQVLPESGHLIANVNTKIGLIAKDSIGLGVSNLKVNILENGEKINEIQLSEFGMGSIEVIPNIQSDYKIEFYYNNIKREVNFPVIENIGIALGLKDSEDDLTVLIKSNKETLNTVEGELYKITLHNSVTIKTYDVILQNKGLQELKLLKKDLLPGINIITIFNSQGQPIAERLYFNYKGLDFSKIVNPIVNSTKDSIVVKLPFTTVDVNKFQSLSISVLPAKTKSYNHHSNIVSSQLLQPYLRNPIQNANYYFQGINEQKKKDLDVLLLTEGWSRYNWNKIFNYPPEYIYDFEVGASYKLNSNSNKLSKFLVYPNFNTKTDFVTIEAKGSIVKSGFFPLKNEELRIGKLNDKGQLESSKLVVQFYPSKIPLLKSKFKPLTSLDSYQTSNYGVEYGNVGMLDKVQELDEVKVTKKREFTKIEKLKNQKLGKIIEFNEKLRRNYRTFGQFISSYGYQVEETPSDERTGYSIFRIWSYIRTSINASQVPTIFLDDVLLVDFNVLNNYSMQNIDYVEVNKGGIGEGIRGGAGVIRIYNKPIKPDLKYIERESYTSYTIPLTFDKPKEFYAPKYGSFKTKFFEDYGVIDWKPKLEVKNGYLNLKILNTNQPVKLFLEGVVNNNKLISQELIID